jgi:hypothetical protein
VSIAEESGARVIHEPRRGYGRACAIGAGQARCDILVFLDADGADDPSRINDLVSLVEMGMADLALGFRLRRKIEAGARHWHQRGGNWVCSRLINLLYGCNLTDLSPFRAVRKERLAELGMVEMTYGYPTEMIVKVARHGWQMVEIPVSYFPRKGGQSKISETLKGTILATYFIFKVIFRYTGYENER